jgi:16S rRNA (cytosine1402-N4)-methyltransferase
MPHIPVLLKEVIEILKPQPGEFFIDGTVGGGGHAAEIIKRIGSKGKFLGIDWDENNSNELISVHGNFADLPEILKNLPAGRQGKLGKADGLFLDLGFSSEQLESGKGFSFSGPEEPLLMIYDQEMIPVKDWLKKLTEKELTEIIRNFGDERYAGRISRAIKQNRFPVETNKQLAEVVSQAVPGNYERGRIHPATRTFLALRIFANQELLNLKKVLNSLNQILKVGGRIAIISFNSSEDRIVKIFFREQKKEGKMEILTKKPISPAFEEIKQNPRARSAKLRAAILIKN